MRKLFLLLAGLLAGSAVSPLFAQPNDLSSGPAVLVLYDGPDVASNPGRLDALYLVNLLGHFTTRRTVHPLEAYQAGEDRKFDAVFTIIYQRKYRVPQVFLDDIAHDPRPFCWLGNQSAQLDRVGLLRRHGLAYVQFTDQIKFNQVIYKGQTIDKGDPETNILRVSDPALAVVLATATAPGHAPIPYAVRSGNFWLF